MTITKDTEVLLIKKTGPFDSQHQGVYWRLTWLNAETNEMYESTIATHYYTQTMKNFKRWQHIVESEESLGVYVGLKEETKRKTNGKVAVISADSKPYNKLPLLQSQLDTVIVGLAEYKEPSTFHKVFEIISK